MSQPDAGNFRSVQTTAGRSAVSNGGFSGARRRRIAQVMPIGTPGDHGHVHGDHLRGIDIRACCLSSDEPPSWDAVSSWLARLRQGAGKDLLRVKGIVNLIGESTPVAIQGVHHVFHPPVLLDVWPDADHRSRIVFITRGIERADLEASFFEHVAAARV